MGDLTASLDALRNYRTRYEAALIFPDGRRMLVAYVTRHTKAGLLDAIRARGKAILAQMPNLSDDAVMTYSKARGFDLGNGCRVAWTGRTQRDALCGGALPYVAE